MIMSGSRIVYRIWKERGLRGFAATQGQPVFVLGAEAAGGVRHR
jgi:hypothetical protein